MNNLINVAKDFYPRPAGRFHEDGNYSGQAFRENLLIPKLEKLPLGQKLIIDFTGVSMAGSSFLEESFGGLVRVAKFNQKKLLNQLEIIGPRVVIKEKIINYIKNARPE